MKYILRIIVSPAVAFIVLVAMLYKSALLIKNFIIHGGEFIAYTQKDTPKVIGNVYDQVNELLKQKSETN